MLRCSVSFPRSNLLEQRSSTEVTVHFIGFTEGRKPLHVAIVDMFPNGAIADDASRTPVYLPLSISVVSTGGLARPWKFTYEDVKQDSLFSEGIDRNLRTKLNGVGNCPVIKGELYGIPIAMKRHEVGKLDDAPSDFVRERSVLL